MVSSTEKRLMISYKMDVAVMCLVWFITLSGAQGVDNRVALKIHGGLNAFPGQFPSIGYIVGSDGNNTCGATLISQEWAVSAAHCFFGLEPGDPVPVRVVFGNIDTSFVADSHQESYFDTFIHEDYNDDTLANDIALIQLKTPVNITDFVKPVNLSTTFADTSTFRKCFVAGWGATEDDVYPDILQFAEIQIQERNVCEDVFEMESISASQSESFYSDNSFNEDLMICAGSNNSDACDGDSGGPMYCINDLSQNQMLVGVVSYGQANCTPAIYGVYTRISAYTQWIEQTSAGESTICSLCFLCLMISFGKLLSSS